LAPWGRPEDLEQRKLLVVREIDSVEALAQARAAASFSYIHILAHGARVAEADMEEHESEWGLRLGRVDTAAAPPQAIADALKPVNEHPLVVTLAACDSASADRPELGNSSLVETLHRSGIPVVVASQFPLTKPGSVTLTRAFYGRLLGGADVRIALHAARVALREEARQVAERRHDWLSLVGYVRLPAEGYSRYLRVFGLRVQLHMLEAARKDAEPLFAQDSPEQDAFEKVAARLDDRIKDLQGRRALLVENHDRTLQTECCGLLASASKSLAELRFVQGRHFSQAQTRLEVLSRTALEDSHKWYAEVYLRDLSQHWQGVQKLALEAALKGGIANPTELMFVRYAAQIASDTHQGEYWACGTLAEAILLGTLVPQGFDLKGAQTALNALCERSSKDPHDRGFAVKSTRRQFERYVNWWTKGNGYFPGRDSDLSLQALALMQCL
jgi:CHAT domain